jgi:ribulose-5-phosphate 4-epimerase/fuculose-1-phosphate aldolase
VGEQSELRGKILTACRILSHRGLVEAFGHFSARAPGAETFLVTPRRGLRPVTRPEQLVEVDLAGRKVSGDSDPPLEVHIHSCLYRARADIRAIARTHSFHASVLGVVSSSRRTRRLSDTRIPAEQACETFLQRFGRRINAALAPRDMTASAQLRKAATPGCSASTRAMTPAA